MSKLGLLVGVAALGGGCAVAVLIASHITTGEGLANALVAERSPTQQAASAASQVPPVLPAPATAPSAERDGAHAPISPESLPAVVSYRQTSTYNGAPVFVPDGCSKRYDLILHFHGAHPYVLELMQRANLPAVVAVFNAGNGAEKYAQAYGAGGTLSSLLRQIDMAVAPLCEGGKLGRVALMAWSAGYAATEKLLTREEDRNRVDALLLADGLHAGFTDPWRRTFAPNALSAFREFGLQAKRGEKLFSITHSSIMTDGYGSTTECSRLLLTALDVPCEGKLVSGHAGDFSIDGFTGEDKAAHIAQFRQMDSTLLSKLRERWSK